MKTNNNKPYNSNVMTIILPLNIDTITGKVKEITDHFVNEEMKDYLEKDKNLRSYILLANMFLRLNINDDETRDFTFEAHVSDIKSKEEIFTKTHKLELSPEESDFYYWQALYQITTNYSQHKK